MHRARLTIQWLIRRLPAATLIAIGIAATVWLAQRSTEPQPLSGGEQGAWAAIAAGANLLGAAWLARIGRVGPGHARSAVRRLIDVGGRLTMLQHTAEETRGAQRAGVDAFVGLVERQLESVRLTVGHAILDWRDVHPEALRDVEEES